MESSAMKCVKGCTVWDGLTDDTIERCIRASNQQRCSMRLISHSANGSYVIDIMPGMSVEYVRNNMMPLFRRKGDK